MATRNLLESATLVESPDTGSWRVKLINEGKGSSGIYPASTLEQFHQAFDGALSFENHPPMFEGPESRNFTQIVGAVVGESWTSVDEQGKTAIYANWEPDPEQRDRLARYKSNLGLSIYIEGDGHVDEDGNFVVDYLNANDPYKSVDVVLAAGRGGRFEESMKEMYSQRRGENKPGTETSVQEGKDIKDMDKDEIKALVNEAVSAAIAPLVSAQNDKAEEAAQIEADGKAVTEALEAYDAARKLVSEAELITEQADALLAEAKTGVDITAKVAAAKAIGEAYEKRLNESANDSAGRFHSGGTDTTWKSGAWA